MFGAVTGVHKFILLVFSELLVAGCAFTPSQLNAHPDRYDGIIVVLRGIVKLTPEANVLCESRALDREFQRSLKLVTQGFELKTYQNYCVTIENPDLLYKNLATVNAKRIIVQGKFIDQNQIWKTVDPSVCPLPTAIIINNAVLARRYPWLLPHR
jgi:hypothetical protein